MQAGQARRFRVLSVLGAGGFGTVYRAEVVSSSGLRREVALKVLNPEAAKSEDAARRLRDEARILSHLKHHGIVRVDDLLQLEGRWTMVMELVDGVDCEELIQRTGPMPPGIALSVVEAVARTLHVAVNSTDQEGERLELVHRDVKPANILISVGGVPKLLDFGVARAQLAEREASTQTAYVMGSLPYLAPERYGFEDLPAGDVYALGCVLYELLVGERLGRTSPNQDRHTEHLRKGLHRAWEVIEGVHREPVLKLLARCLAYDHATRPSARELATELFDLIQEVRGPRLDRWAEETVRRALAMREEAGPDELCGRVLSEDLSGESLEASIDELEVDTYSLPRPHLTSSPVVVPQTPTDRPSNGWASMSGPSNSGGPRPPAAPPSLRVPRSGPTDPMDPADLTGPIDEASVPAIEATDPAPEMTAELRPAPLARAPERVAVVEEPSESRMGLALMVFGLFALAGVIVLGLVLRGVSTAPSAPEPRLINVMEGIGGEDLPEEPALDAGRAEEPEVEPVGVDPVPGLVEADPPVERDAPVQVKPDAPVQVKPDAPAQVKPDAPVQVKPVAPAQVKPVAPAQVEPDKPDEPVASVEPDEPVGDAAGDAEPVAPDPPAAEKAPAAILRFGGDAEFVRVVGARGEEKDLSALPPGTYRLFPSFPGGYMVPGPAVTLQAGDDQLWTCLAESRSCTR